MSRIICLFAILLIVIIVSINLKLGDALANEETFGIANSTNEKSILKEVNWHDVVAKIESGEIDLNVIIAMTTGAIPEKYDTKGLQDKFMKLYEEYAQALLDNAKDQESQFLERFKADF